MLYTFVNTIYKYKLFCSEQNLLMYKFKIMVILKKIHTEYLHKCNKNVMQKTWRG